MKIESFGELNGQIIKNFILNNGKTKLSILNYGGIINSVIFPDKKGKVREIVLGFDTFEKVYNNTNYAGAIIGRFGNRIEKGEFYIDGKKYNVTKNEKGNTLHGGKEGFNRKIWKDEILADNSLKLSYLSIDGEEGFPANLLVSVVYTLTDNDEIRIEYFAESDGDTIINLTNHSYFNPEGRENSTDGLLLMIDADKITPVDDSLITHGEFKSVENTLYDFRKERKFIVDLSTESTLSKRGCYDENFVLNGDGLRKVSAVKSETSGISVEVYTDQPGMQIFTGNSHGIALETQNFPNAVNCPEYPSAVLHMGEKYHTVTIYALKII